MAISGATLALVVAGTAVVTANHDSDQRGFGRDRAGAQLQRGGGGFGGGMRGGFGPSMRGGFGGMMDSFVRRETTVDQGEDGIVTRRVDNGIVASASDSGLDYTLQTGESATVTIDEDTQAYAFSERTESNEDQCRRCFRGPRLIPTEITVAAIEAGSDVVVWSESQDDGSFLAQRIVVRPTVDEATEAVDATTDAAAAVVITDA
jgi:hypothetical protein